MKAGESAVVPIRRDPLTSGLDRQRGEVCVRNKVALGPGFLTKTNKDFPMAVTGRDQNAVRLRPQHFTEVQRHFYRGWWRKDAWMRDDADEAAQNELGETEGRLRAGDPLEPVEVGVVLGGIGSVAVDEDVYVGKDQAESSMASSSDALSSRSTPG
jgi:hypothetical protein